METQFYQVSVTEILTRNYKVRAKNLDNATDKLQQAYFSELVVLDHTDFAPQQGLLESNPIFQAELPEDLETLTDLPILPTKKTIIHLDLITNHILSTLK